MRLPKTISIILISFISLYSLSAEAQFLTPTEIPRTVTMEEARQFIDEYVVRFTKLDLEAFMALFSKEATENRALPYADIREAYRKTVANTQSITYNLKIISIQAYAKSAFVSGRYEIIQALKSGKERVFRGSIQWDIVRENGSLKVREVNYGRDH